MRVQDLQSFKQKALKWAATAEVCCMLDSNGYEDKYSSFDLMLAVGTQATLNGSTADKFHELKTFWTQNQNWMFGLMSYDLKNELEQLQSTRPDHLRFPEMFFFVPQHLIRIKGEEIDVLIGEASVIATIENFQHQAAREQQDLNIQPRIPKKTYLQTVETLKQHILRGDIYEVNFCQEFFAENAIISPADIYEKLCEVSPTPFAGFFKIYDQYILSASPERYLCKQGNKLISQPIKGTAKRCQDPQHDLQAKDSLRLSAKEQAENVMIVDLVRNDLTRAAVCGTVKVEELFGIYAFPQVYQMISTISCELSGDIHFIDAIKHIFPMGSMTGAPKVKAMQLIEKYEFCKRGAYSGALGYITPDADFDFNVIIRSMLYDADKSYLSFQVGGAITYSADAEAEYEECLLKASAIIRTLKS